jgi:hypothetical protein
MKRISLNLVLFLSLFFLPWWATIFFALVGFMSFDFYEGIFWGAFLDMWWFRESSFLLNNVFVCGAVILFILAHLFKKSLKI